MWLIIAVASVFLYKMSTQAGDLIGVVDTVAEEIAPLETLRLQSVNVVLGQQVKAGDIIAQMDTSIADAAIAEIDAEMFEAESSIGNFERSTLGIVKQFESDIKDAKAQIEDLTRLKDMADARLTELQAEQKRRDALFRQKLIDAQTANELKPEISALKKEVTAYPFSITIEEDRLNAAIQEQKNLAGSMRLNAGEDIKEAIKRRAEAQKQIFSAMRETVRVNRENCTLRASCNGVISRIFYQPGSVVPAGTSIARIIVEHPVNVIVFLPEVHLGTIKENQKVSIWRITDVGGTLKGTIKTISPEIDTFPGRVTPIQGQEMRGRRVLVQIEENHDMIPGETVQVRTEGKLFDFHFNKKLTKEVNREKQ